MDGNGVVTDNIVIPHLPVKSPRWRTPFPGDGTAAQVFCIRGGVRRTASPSTVTLLLGVEHQSADGDLRFLYLHRAQLGIAAQLAFHARNQLGRVERLCNVIIRTRGQSEDFVRVLALGRQQDDRQIFTLSYL